MMQSALDGFLQYSGTIQPNTIVRYLNHHIASVMKCLKRDGAARILACCYPGFSRFNSMIEAVAHQMCQWISNFFYQPFIQLG